MSSDVFTQFQKHYSEGDFQQALELLENHKAQFDTSIYHYNKGTLLAKMQKVGEARFHLEMAKTYGLASGELRNNLEVLRRETGVYTLEQSAKFPDQVRDSLQDISFQAYLSISLIFVILALLMFYKRVRATVCTVFFVMALIPIPLKFYLDSTTSAVVRKEAIVHEGPSAIFQEINRLPEGLKVQLGEYRDQWFFVERPQVFNGWVHQDVLSKIPKL